MPTQRCALCACASFVRNANDTTLVRIDWKISRVESEDAAGPASGKTSAMGAGVKRRPSNADRKKSSADRKVWTIERTGGPRAEWCTSSEVGWGRLSRLTTHVHCAEAGGVPRSSGAPFQIGYVSA